MKKILLFMIAAMFVTVSCSGQSNKKKDQKVEIEKLTKAEFIKKVFDFEKPSADFKYLGDKPAIVEFYADWCGACKALAPTLQELAAEYKDRIHIYKVNVDREPDISAAFGVEGLPTLIFIPMEGNGEPQVSIGAMPKDDLKKAIESVLLAKPGK